MKRDHLTRLRQKVISYLASFLMVISLFPTNTVLAQEEYTYEPVAVTNAQADSEEPTAQGDGPASFAFDNNYSTQWHTNWSNPSEGDKTMPHWISWQLNDPATIGRIDYVGKPGANGVGNGVFKDISIFVTEDSNAQPNDTGEGWKLVQSYSDIAYSATSGTEQDRTATFTFTPVMASKVLIVVKGSYSVPDDPDGENVFANAREIITYKATPIDSEPEPIDDLRINVTIDGKSYEGKSIQQIVEDNGISKSAVKEFAVTGGNLEYADLEFIGNGNTFYFANLQNLTIDLSNATMYDADGNVTTELPSSIFGTIKNLRELYLPGVTKIGNSTFKQAGALNGIEVLEIPDVVEIGNRAFQGGKFAASYKTLDLANVEVIGDLAFDCVNSFNTVNLDSIKVLGDTAIDAEVSSLTMPGTITSLGHNAIIIADGGQVVFEGDTPPETPTVSGWYPFGDHKFTLVSDSTAFKEAYENGKFGKVENITWQGPSDPIESLYEVTVGLDGETIDVSEYIDSPSATAPNGHYNYGKADLSELSISIKTSSKITGNVNYSINDGVGISKGSFATKDSGTTAEKIIKASGSNYFKSVSFDFTIEGKAYGLTIHFMESVPSFDKLKELLDQANNISGEGYETESFNTFKVVRDDVQDFYDQYSVRLWQTSQSKVDEYYNKLNTALNALEKVSSVDKTKLEETIVSANLAVFAATHQVVVTDGLDELEAAIAKAETVSANDAATQVEVDAMVEELNAAMTYMKEHEIQIEVLSIVSSDEDSITLEVNSDPFGEYAYVYDDEHSGMSETIKWTEEDVADGKAHITANNLEKGENYFYVHFLNRWTTSQNRYWVYVNTETGESDFGNVKDIVKPSVVLNVGEENVEITSEDTAQVVEVPYGVEALTATVSGKDIGGATLTYSNESAQASVDPSADHKTVELNVQNAAGELVAGTYTVTVETGYKGVKPGGGASYGAKYSFEFSVELAKPTVDKTKLQALYDEAVNYNRDNVKGYEQLQERLESSKSVLDNNEVTQEKVDKEVIQLDGRYSYVLMQELSKDNQDKVYSTNYTTESLKSLVEVDQVVSTKSTFSKSLVLKQDDVETVKAWIEKYEKALTNLVEADDSTKQVGAYNEGLAVSSKDGEPQGEFTVLTRKTAVENGEKKYEINIQFNNTGNHPIYGESFTKYDGTEVKFGKFGGTNNAKLYVNTYDENMSPIGREVVDYNEFVALEGNTSKTPGFTATVKVPVDTKYFTIDYVYERDHTYSAGYWVVDRLDEDTVVTVLIDGNEFSGSSLEEAIEKSEIDADDVETIEFVSGTITQADLDYLKEKTTYLKKLTINLSEGLTLENGSTVLPDGQFGLTRLETVTLGGFTEIGARAFEECANLETVNMPDVVKIGRNAFYHASEFEKFTLPASIQEIGADAFDAAASGTRELDVTIEAKTPPTGVDPSAFADGTITVPEGSLGAYLPNIDLSKTFRSSGDSKWYGLKVIDPSYHLVTFQYGDSGDNRLFAYYKDGSKLASVEIGSFTIPEGQKLTGWNTSKDGNGTSYTDDTDITSDITLYPVYEEVVPYVTVVGVLEDDGKHVRFEINGPLKTSSSNCITTPQESTMRDLNGFKYEFYEGKHTIVTDSYRQHDFDRVALISAESKTTVNCLYYDENGDLQFYSYQRGDGMKEGSAPIFTVSGKKGASNVNVDVTDRGIDVPEVYEEVIRVDGNPNQTVLTITGVDLCTNNTGAATAVDKLELVKRDENGKEEYRIEGTISRDHKTITFVIENENTGAAESGEYYTEPAILSGTYFYSKNVGPHFRTCFELNVSKLSNTLYYDANGGEGGPSSNYTNDKNITIQSKTPTRDGYEFVGWNTKADGTGTTYQPSSSYPIDPNGIGGQKVTLYAMWQEQEIITLTPEEDLTGYTGGDSLNDTSFPNMRYTISLPEDVDPSSEITLHYTNSKGEEGTTTIGNYTQGLSLLAEGEGVQTTEPVLIPELEPSYKLNDKEVEDDSEPGVYDFEVKNDEDLYAEIKGKKYTVNVDDKDTTITVRYVSDPERMSDANTDYINDVVNEAPATEVEEATAVTDPNTTYLTNDKEDIAVMNEDAVGLLVDELLSDDDGFDREKAMLEKLNGFLDEKDKQTVSEGNYDFMYLDLVNTKDGNAWVSSTNGTDIYLPYPEGTDKNTQFNVVHFPGLHREYGFKGKDEVGVAIENCNPELVSIEKTAQGIKFHIGQSGFSPFALTWSDSKTEFDVSYVFKSEDGRVLPQEVNALLPTAQTATEGSTVSPQALTTTSITTSEGVWTFKGWDQQSVTVSQNVVFTGTWSFAANSSLPVFDLGDINTTIEQGSKFDPLAGIHATDAQGNDITGSIKVVSNNVNTSKPGKYTVTYEVADQYGNISHVTVEFTVKAKETGGSQTANKDDLKDLIDKADKLDADKYTKDSWNALEKALEQAKNVYKDPSATAEEINSAYNALNNAMKNLKKVSEKGNDANTAAQMNAALYGGIAIVALGAMLICIRKRSKKS